MIDDGCHTWQKGVSTSFRWQLEGVTQCTFQHHKPHPDGEYASRSVLRHFGFRLTRRLGRKWEHIHVRPKGKEADDATYLGSAQRA